MSPCLRGDIPLLCASAVKILFSVSRCLHCVIMVTGLISLQLAAMPEKKKDVAEGHIQDVFEGRHPSESEKRWAEQTLAPALEKSPEKPIGAPTGTNLDEHGNARFTTISGYPVRRLYTQADLPEDWEGNYERYLNHPGQPPFTRGIHA